MNNFKDFKISQMNLSSDICPQNKSQAGFSSHVVMVRPFIFCSNSQTASDNIYQVQTKCTKQEINKKAVQQFDTFVQKLRENHVKVTVVQDEGNNQTPDSIYPNNWISFHQGLKAILYPMYAPNRRKEREIPLISIIEADLNQCIEIWHDYTNLQDEGIFLEGTGSMVLDREKKIVYAVISQRTNKKLLEKCCNDLGYKQCSFRASQYCKERNQKSAIYHTNVLMGLSRHFVLISFELIDSQEEREMVKRTLEEGSGKKIIELSGEQILNFVGNTLTVVNSKGEDLLIMSETAFKSLRFDQTQEIQKYTKILYTDLKTIEQNGGGSARCMLAQVF